MVESFSEFKIESVEDFKYDEILIWAVANTKYEAVMKIQNLN